MLSTLLSVTWEIKQDGTGDFTTIGAGITVAQDGDTLLVYPGIYYERINYQGKNITITSLYDGDEYDESYIANTVIDGNHEGTVVIFNSGETRDAILNGFTIRHGKGEPHSAPHFPGLTVGGGVYISEASPIINNCIIEKNYALSGGGLSLMRNGHPLLKGNTIRFNSSSVHAAGILASSLPTDYSNIEFSTQSMNSIYLNSGLFGNDLYFSNSEQSAVVIDTFTVLHPDEFFIRFGIHSDPELNISINNGKIDPISADLFVNPCGNDTNSGLSPYEPLQTISRAMATILPDSLQQRTIHLAEGVYSPSINNQLFPVQLRKYISLQGTGKNVTILDGEFKTLLLGVLGSREQNDIPVVRNFSVKNVTLINGGNEIHYVAAGGITLQFTADFIFHNIDITNCHTGNPSTFRSISAEGNYSLKNIHIYDNTGGTNALNLNHLRDSYNFYAENIRIRNQQPGPSDLDIVGYGGGMRVAMQGSEFQLPLVSVGTIVNLEITDCFIDNTTSGLPFGNLMFIRPGSFRVINATIGNNHSTNNTGGGLSILEEGVHVEVINSIIYGNFPHNIALRNNHEIPSSLTVSHSLVGGGLAGIYYSGNFDVHWGEGNIDADPLWLEVVDPDYDGDYHYMLSEHSPARNAGTLDIPNFEFPLYDLAGNPRIYGDSIDIGAYEWNPEASIDDNDTYHAISLHNYNLHNYPNPVVSLKGMGRGKGVGTNISFIMPKEGHVVIDIYNVKGQFIRRLINAYMVAGEYNFLWNGKDEQERIVATGFYMYRLEIDGETVATGRYTFIK